MSQQLRNFLLDVGQRVEELRAALPTTVERVGKWKLNYIVLRKPEMFCPYCKEPWTNDWTWVIDGRKKKVLGAWDEDGFWQSSSIGIHPHVDYDGVICMGDTTDPVMAITAAFDAKSCYGDFADHMDMLGHGGCEATWKWEEERYWCESCEDYYGEEDVRYCDSNDGWYCDNCWSEGHSYCDLCEDTIHDHQGDHGYYVENTTLCERCYIDKIFRCEECEEEFFTDDHYGGDGLCDTCFREKEQSEEEEDNDTISA